MFHLPSKKGKRTGSIYNRRREMFIEILNEHFEKVVGSEVEELILKRHKLPMQLRLHFLDQHLKENTQPKVM